MDRDQPTGIQRVTEVGFARLEGVELVGLMEGHLVEAPFPCSWVCRWPLRFDELKRHHTFLILVRLVRHDHIFARA